MSELTIYFVCFSRFLIFMLPSTYHMLQVPFFPPFLGHVTELEMFLSLDLVTRVYAFSSKSASMSLYSFYVKGRTLHAVLLQRVGDDPIFGTDGLSSNIGKRSGPVKRHISNLRTWPTTVVNSGLTCFINH